MNSFKLWLYLLLKDQQQATSKPSRKPNYRISLLLLFLFTSLQAQKQIIQAFLQDQHVPDIS